VKEIPGDMRVRMHAAVNLLQECRSAVTARRPYPAFPAHSEFKPLINGLPYYLFNKPALI
jgi:hypothetical protein